MTTWGLLASDAAPSPRPGVNQFALWPFPANAFSSDIPGVGGYAIGINVWTDGTGGSDLAVEGADTGTSSSKPQRRTSRSTAWSAPSWHMGEPLYRFLRSARASQYV
jgi:hypothetical protein